MVLKITTLISIIGRNLIKKLPWKRGAISTGICREIFIIYAGWEDV
jgi:hypothetical protein